MASESGHAGLGLLLVHSGSVAAVKIQILNRRSGHLSRFFLNRMLAMTTDEVMDALGRYTKDSKETDRQTAAKLGVTRSVLWDWLRGKTQPERCTLARLAGFLKRSGYL
jgi:transcriptional regulator with XRE-family HTH domain